ncbi:uncharacterized protein IL334_001920 [Kwoniella shivajii]|uniref:Nascent polypeptide-associated complex subunit alpha-like UBA domain-containing protein n=1 Tax=Kwoniella shivajii TaxID=564305 RepID=A0ABZ1CUF8_9TREE|nr:hypothetical protein IL334_001920 [Kwoniella shivajii]
MEDPPSPREEVSPSPIKRPRIKDRGNTPLETLKTTSQSPVSTDPQTTIISDAESQTPKTYIHTQIHSPHHGIATDQGESYWQRSYWSNPYPYPQSQPQPYYRYPIPSAQTNQPILPQQSHLMSFRSIPHSSASLSYSLSSGYSAAHLPSTRPPTPSTPQGKSTMKTGYHQPSSATASSTTPIPAPSSYIHRMLPSRIPHLSHPQQQQQQQHPPPPSSAPQRNSPSTYPEAAQSAVNTIQTLNSRQRNSLSPPLRSIPTTTTEHGSPEPEPRVTVTGKGKGKGKGKHKGIPGPKARISHEAKVIIAEHIISKGVTTANLDELAQTTGLTKQQIKSQLVDNRQNVRRQLNEFVRGLQ